MELDLHCRRDPRGHEEHAGLLGKAELDLHTLVWTRGAAFPISQLDRCGEGRGQPRGPGYRGMWWYQNTTRCRKVCQQQARRIIQGSGIMNAEEEGLCRGRFRIISFANSREQQRLLETGDGK